MDWEVRAASLVLLLAILLVTIPNGIAERRIVCYYTNWSVYRPGTAKFSPQNINPYLCTHLIYAFGGFTKDNTLKPFDKYQDIEKGGYAKFTGLKTYNKNLKTMLAIGGWNEGSSRFSPMVADPARRREFVKNAVKFLRQNHFDGLDLDWEYPAFRDGGKPRDKDNYANLVQELRDEFNREASKTGRSRLLLSMAMPAGIEYIDKGYDVPRLNDYLDFINLLSYDYHSAYEPAVNHHSPLYPLEEDNEYNYDAELTIDYTINHLLEKGASADKIVLGIPTYGRSYTLFNEDATELGSPADGPGVEGEATREKGYLAYYEICESVAESDWEVFQPNPNAMGPYAFKDNQWVGYDDEDIVKLKARYVNEKKLGGIMFWSIDNDDFRGKCHGRPYPLIEAAKEALLTDSRNTIDKTKSVDGRKKTRTQTSQSNSLARKFGSSSRRSTTAAAPTIRKRGSSTRNKYYTITRSKTSDEEQEDREVSRRSYEPSTDEDSEGGNTVRVTEKTERPKNRSRSKTRSGSTDRNTRRKQFRRKGQAKTDEGESLSNKLTTPEPPTTPDPGTDFKCEDEGFFSHPRDCKKYFWCLDSGPGGLGVVAHQFTCPSGLVFNKAADSCDYPRNVICPKSKTSVVSTTRSPITAATSRTTYLHSTTTPKAKEKEEEEEEEEEYDSEDYDEDEIEESEEEEVKEEPKPTTTAKPLVYKTLTRSRPSTTTTTSRPSETSPERTIDTENEEDPRVIKELIDLIKKAGGIEQLEKQLLLQEKSSDTTSDSASVTPATISRSLYERVLNRQTNKIANQRPVLVSSETSYVNGPGRAQFEGLDDIPEVKSLRRSQKPQYVTIERPKSNKKENEDDDEDEEDDNVERVFPEDQGVSNPLEGSSSTQRVTPSYVNIRRARPSTTTSRNENDVGEKEAEVEEERPSRRRRPPFSTKQQDNEAGSETSKFIRNRGSVFSFRNSEKDDGAEGADRSTEKDDGSSTTKSRYTSVQRFRSTTSKIFEDSLSAIPPLSEPTSETASPTRVEEYSEVSSTTTPASTTTSLSTTATPTTSTSTEVFTVISVEPSGHPSSVSSALDATIVSTTEPVKLVEDSATEILLTTVPGSSTSQLTTTTTASRSTVSAVSQPRPFGFTRRRSGGSSETATATTTPSSNQVRSKIADSEAIRLPTLKELIGYPTTYDFTVTPSYVLSHLPRFDVDNDISRQTVEESEVGGANGRSGLPGEFASDNERKLVEETGDSWLRQASESKTRSRVAKSSAHVPEEETLVTNAIQEDENKASHLSTAIYLKPTTMRGIPLVNPTPGSVTRGFYVTKSDNDLSSSTWIESFTSTYGSTDPQTETTAIPDVSTTDEVVTAAHRGQNESESSTVDDNANDVVNDENKAARGAEFSTFDSSEGADDLQFRTTIFPEVSGSADNTYEDSEVTVNPVDGSTLKRGKSLRDFDQGTTSLPNLPVASPTTPTRRAIALAVSRYNELATPLWSGRRLVAKKRIRTTVSPIKDAIRRTEDDLVRNTASIFRTGSVVATTPSIPITTRRFSVISTVPTIAPEQAISPETSSVYDNLTSSAEEETEDPRNRTTTEATITLTIDSTITESVSDPSIASTAGDSVGDLTSRITDDPGTVTTPASVDVTGDTLEPTVAQPPAAIDSTTFEDETTLANVNYTTGDPTTVIASDSTTIIVGAAGETPASTTANYLAVTTPARASTRAMDVDSASTGLEVATSAIGGDSTVAATTDMPANVITDPVITLYTLSTASIAVGTASTNNPTTAIPETTSVHEITTDSEPATTVETATTEAEANLTTTQEKHSTTTIPETTTWTMTPTEIVSAIASTTDTDTTTDAITTTASATTIVSTTTDLPNTVAASTNIASTVTDPETTFAASSEVPVANTDSISTGSTAATTSTTESSTIPFVASTVRDINGNTEVPAVTGTAETADTSEIPTTLETSTTFGATSIATPKSLASTDSGIETTPAATTSSTQSDEIAETPTVIQTSSTLPPIANTVTLALGKFTVPSSIPATSRESIATNTILETTARTTNEEPTRPLLKTASEGTTVRPAQNRTRGRTRAELAAFGYEFGRKTSGRTVVHRRVINRPTDGDVETPTTRQPISQYPRRRVTVYRGRPRRPTYASSSKKENLRRRVVQKRLRTSSEATSVRSDENVVDVQNTTEERVTRNRVEATRRKMKVVLKRVKERTEEEKTSASPTEETMALGESSNFTKDEALRAHREDEKVGRRRKIVLKRIKPRPEGNFKKEETNGDTGSLDKSLPGGSTEAEKARRKMRVVLKRLKSASERRNSTSEGANADPESVDETLTHALPANPRAENNLPEEGNARRRMRVVLKSVKPVSKERNATEEAKADPDTTESLRGDYSSGIRTGNLFGARTSRKMRVVLKSVRPKSENARASEDSDSTGDDLQGNFSSHMYVNDDLADDAKTTTRPKAEEEEATTSEQPAEPNTQLRTTKTTSVRVEEDTDRPSHEVNTWQTGGSGGGSASRKSQVGRSNRQRTPTTHSSTTPAPLTNTLTNSASTTYRRSRPFAESTLSSRIDLVDPHEITESSYVRTTGLAVDQSADVSDQSIRAQEFAVTLADPPSSSSSDTGRTPFRDAERRKISTTIAPRIDLTESRTVSRYSGVSRSRQGPKTKDRPTVNATTRPRRPPVVDYDYYEDEVPVVAGKSLLSSKLFLTSKGTIRCLDQGNFPHPYSCKKFITCARMVNGQVIGTEYTCPAKLSFDPVGGICNWSAGLGCKD